MTIADISERIDLLADRVDPYDLSAASRLRQLSRAFGYGELAEEWAATDIYRLINPTEIVELVRTQGASNRWINLIELVRNVLLLVPIAVTWYGVRRAVDGYYALLSAQPAQAQVPFIFLWQDGFGVQVTPTLGELGLINAGLLGLVIVLTAVALGWSAWQDTVRDRYAETMRRELSEALAIASLHLQTVSRRTPTSLIEHFRDLTNQLIGQIEVERMRITELAERRDREVSTLHQFSAELRLGTQELLDNARLSGDTTRVLAERVAALAQPVTQMASAADSLVAVGAQVAAPLSQSLAVQSRLGEQVAASAQAMQQAASSISGAAAGTRAASEELVRSQTAFVAGLVEQQSTHTSLAESVGQSARGLTVASQAIQEIGDQLATNLGALTPSTVALAEQGGSLLAMTRSLEETSRTLTAQQAAIAEQLGTFIGGFQDATHRTLQTLDSAIALFQQAAGRQDDFLAAIHDERLAQAELARLMSSGTIEFESLSESIRESSVSLHAIAVDLSELRDALPRLPDGKEL